MSAWSAGPMVGLDTETTSVDVKTARIVTAAVVHVHPSQRPRTISWVLDPGVEIPEEAAAIHGWTNDRLHQRLGGPDRALRITAGGEQPMSRDGALFEIAAQTATVMHTETPLVVHNAAYDLTVLEAELQRNAIDTLSSRPSGIRGVVDPMVIERQFDPYRKVKDGCRGGKHRCGGCGATDKTLTSLCRHYGLVLAAAHEASADALAGVRLAARLSGMWPEIARWKLPTLHGYQVTWRKEQSDSLRSFWKRQGDDRWAEVDSGWPLHSDAAPALVGSA